jgi:hypothetical protein
MGKISIKHSRLTPTSSVSLIKDADTGVYCWRHRFVSTTTNGTAGRQIFNDYTYNLFSVISEFKEYIENIVDKEKRLKENA